MLDPTPSSLDSSMIEADLSGRSLGDYQLLRRLGRGGMAEVYLAQQHSLDRQVALKVLRGSLAGDASYVQRFQNEARAAASLVHANIVQIYEVGCAEGVHFIAQEYVQGQNLRELMVRQGPPDLKVAISIIRQVAAALFRAAQRDIVHRDIKPENILITRGGEVKVADFGLARVSRPGDSVNLTQVGITMGTPLYMSPEQVEGNSVDHRSDIYSLGITCYHLLAGFPPFRGDTALTVAVQHLKTQPERLENLRPDLPTALCRMIHKMLEKDPARRYQSGREVLRDLRTVPLPQGADVWDEDEELFSEVHADTAARSESTQRLDTLMKTAAYELQDRGRRWRWGVLLAGILLAVGIGAGAAVALRPPSVLGSAESRRAHIPQQLTAEAQYLFAALHDTEAHWLAVTKHFSNEDVWVWKAKSELALLYVRENNLDAALAVFNQLAAMVEVESNFKAFGLAGQCVVYSAKGRHREALAKVGELQALVDGIESPLQRSRLLDTRMRFLMRSAVSASQRALDQQQDQQLNQWLRDTFGDESSAAAG